MKSLAFLLVALSAFLAALYYGRAARRAGDSEATGRALMMSLPFLVIGFVFLYLGWSQLG